MAKNGSSFFIVIVCVFCSISIFGKDLAIFGRCLRSGIATISIFIIIIGFIIMRKYMRDFSLCLKL